MHHIINSIWTDGTQRPMFLDESPTSFPKEAVKVVSSLLVSNRAEWPTLLMNCYWQLHNTWILPPHCIVSEHDDAGVYIPAASG